MAILKCKMCGGDLNIIEGETVAVCEYCDTKQTVPTADNEKKMTLFARANRLRAANEFDKAAGIYESIVADFPEEAEAYWGLVLCKFGIEYVDDPATGKKIPTCHRSSFDSIMDDSDFEQVMENADAIARRVYREEAKAIEELRKNIIEVSSKEEPYDIFICYKEKDENGRRTIDSLIAQDVYDALTEIGYRVFFSRITLKGKLGREFEPCIFAALSSAKIMLVFGTDYEYYNSVWVKNEWSRFLSLIAKGEKKTLIPCYKDIDAYDMPKEFRSLQSQDMGQVGAIQDLLRGIGMILPKENPMDSTAYDVNSSNVKTQALLKRMFIFLEDKDWENANLYCERILDMNSECVEAYFGKICAELQYSSLSEMATDDRYIERKNQNNEVYRYPAVLENNNYKRALKYANEKQKTELSQLVGKAQNLVNRNFEAEKEDKYLQGKRYMTTANDGESFCYAAKCFQSIIGYKDSQELYNSCLNSIEQIQRKKAEENKKWREEQNRQREEQRKKQKQLEIEKEKERKRIEEEQSRKIEKRKSIEKSKNVIRTILVIISVLLYSFVLFNFITCNGIEGSVNLVFMSCVLMSAISCYSFAQSCFASGGSEGSLFIPPIVVSILHLLAMLIFGHVFQPTPNFVVQIILLLVSNIVPCVIGTVICKAIDRSTQ